MTPRPDHCSLYVQAFMVFIVAVAALYVAVLLLLDGTQMSAVVSRFASVLPHMSGYGNGIGCLRCLIPFAGAMLISVFAYRYLLRRARKRIKR
jgi:hypothetical protein